MDFIDILTTINNNPVLKTKVKAKSFGLNEISQNLPPLRLQYIIPCANMAHFYEAIELVMTHRRPFLFHTTLQGLKFYWNERGKSTGGINESRIIVKCNRAYFYKFRLNSHDLWNIFPCLTSLLTDSINYFYLYSYNELSKYYMLKYEEGHLMEQQRFFKISVKSWKFLVILACQ